MGDATGVYTGMNSVWVVPPDDLYLGVTRVANWNYCQYANAIPGAKLCYSQDDPDWKTNLAMNPWWNASEVCQNNYVFDPFVDAPGNQGSWSNFGRRAVPGMQLAANPWIALQKRTARTFRQNVMAQEKAAGAPGSVIASECKAIFEACHGRESCDYGGCVPEVLQYSCVPKADFLAEATGGMAARVVTMFGSLRVSARLLGGSCVTWMERSSRNCHRTQVRRIGYDGCECRYGSGYGQEGGRELCKKVVCSSPESG